MTEIRITLSIDRVLKGFPKDGDATARIMNSLTEAVRLKSLVYIPEVGNGGAWINGNAIVVVEQLAD